MFFLCENSMVCDLLIPLFLTPHFIFFLLPLPIFAGGFDTAQAAARLVSYLTMRDENTAPKSPHFHQQNLKKEKKKTYLLLSFFFARKSLSSSLIHSRAYDQAAIKFRGVDADINFVLDDYEEEIKKVIDLSREQPSEDGVLKLRYLTERKFCIFCVF